MKKLAMHITFEKNLEGKREQFIYISDGAEVTRYDVKSKKFAAFVATLGKDTTLRSTSANSTDALIGTLDALVGSIEYAHWHSTGLEKGLPPEEIVSRYALLPDVLFRRLVWRADIAELKVAVALRAALMQYEGDATRRFKQQGRNVGIANLDDLKGNEAFAAALKNLAEIKSQMKAESGVSFDTEVARIARKVPECRLFNSISGMGADSIIAATVVALMGDPARFEQVSSVWKYFGQHVVNGRMPKRAKGEIMDWNPAGRTILHMLGQCIIKNRQNPWRAMFDEVRAQEIASHEAKHPGCKTPNGHCTAMAARKVAKEIIKRYYLAATGQQFEVGHTPTSNEVKTTVSVSA